jgi:hypothetical protein
MKIDMTKVEADVKLFSAVREASRIKGTQRYAKTRYAALEEVKNAQGWAPAYARLIGCFESVWGYAAFDSWADAQREHAKTES